MYFGDYSIIVHTELLHSLKKKVYVVIYFYFLAALGLRCCMWASSSCGSWPLVAVAALVEPGFQDPRASAVAGHGLSCCGSQV